jgi:hypothetical protein
MRTNDESLPRGTLSETIDIRQCVLRVGVRDGGILDHEQAEEVK